MSNFSKLNDTDSVLSYCSSQSQSLSISESVNTISIGIDYRALDGCQKKDEARAIVKSKLLGNIEFCSWNFIFYYQNYYLEIAFQYYSFLHFHIEASLDMQKLSSIALNFSLKIQQSISWEVFLLSYIT